jgi:glycosyltransferase involved in cell wall biosynthesis
MPPLVMVVGPLPPPVHGAALVTDWVRRRLQDAGAQVLAVDTGPERTGALAYHSQRVIQHLKAAARLWRRRRDLSSVYLGGAGGLGLYYQALVVLAARLAGVRTVFHHHNFAYLDRRHSTMRWLVAAGGRDLEHVALCPRMADLLQQWYPKAQQVVTCSNAGLMEASPEGRPSPAPGRIVLGHLSNLSVEKGLLTVLDTARTVVAAGHDVQLLLGGPAATDEAQRLIEQAQRDLPGVVEHVGKLSREEIDGFHARVDLFLFPSTYVNEAEPLVVLEAARVGVPTIAYAVGCLGALVPDPAALVEPGGDYAGRVAEVVAAMSDDGVRAGARERTAAHFESRRSEAVLAHRQLVDGLLLTKESGTPWQ